MTTVRSATSARSLKGTRSSSRPRGPESATWAINEGTLPTWWWASITRHPDLPISAPRPGAPHPGIERSLPTDPSIPWVLVAQSDTRLPIGFARHKERPCPSPIPKSVRSKIDHPIVDGDGHVVESLPAIAEYMRRIGGSDVADRFIGSSPTYSSAPVPLARSPRRSSVPAPCGGPSRRGGPFRPPPATGPPAFCPASCTNGSTSWASTSPSCTRASGSPAWATLTTPSAPWPAGPSTPTWPTPSTGSATAWRRRR